MESVRLNLKAPFPYFGGKSRVADTVWSRLGDVANYIEPFCGSAAMLLRRPGQPRIETINDADCYVANFWRATSRDPEAVARCADWPVSEADLHARHRWLVLSEAAAEFRQRMRTEPEYYDAKIAGWWCWGLCCWIGSGWCDFSRIERDMGARPAISDAFGRGVHSGGQLPDLSGDAGAAGRGIHASGGPKQKRPQQSGNGFSAGVNARTPGLHKKRPTIADRPAGAGVNGLLPEKHPHLATGNGYGTAINSQGPQPAEWAQMPHLADWNGQNAVNPAVNVPAELSQKIPVLNPGGNAASTPGRGICGVGPDGEHRPQLGDAYSRGRGVHGNDDAGTCERRLAWLVDWFGRLRDRLRTVRVCCGDWLRVCNSHSVTTRLGLTGIFFDPPYSTEAGRDMDLYAVDCGQVAHQVRAYCLERGADPLMRIALCGYEGEGHEELEAAGWDVVAWRAHGGYGNRTTKGRANARRERIWFSPHCQKPVAERMLF